MTATLDLRALHRDLRVAFGPQPWWPGDDPWEIAVGAILVQNTRWENVQLTLEHLRAEGLLDVHALRRAGREHVARAIRSSGFVTAKSRALLGLADWFVQHRALQGGCADLSDADLRRSLLGCFGVGPETADALGLYVFGRSLFIADTYAHRLLDELGFDAPPGYEPLRAALAPHVAAAAFDVDEAAELHLLVLEHGKAHGRKGFAACPLG